jgi:hypothetical protein
MDKVKIAVGELVYYRSDSGARIIGKVRKVNRVNSKVQVFAVNDRIVWRPEPKVIHKSFLRRATVEMQDFIYDYIDPNS